MGRLSQRQREELLNEKRFGVLCMLREDGSPICVPVWFEWTGDQVDMVSSESAPKVERLNVDGRASLLVARDPSEIPEAWVAVDGTVELHRNDIDGIVHRLARRYWDLSDPAKRQLVEEAKRSSIGLRLHAEKVRSWVEEY